MNLSICSYNCCSLNKNIDIVRSLTSRNISIIFLQETFIIDEKLGTLDYIDERYNVVGLGATFSDENLIECAGRPRNGMACLWKKGIGLNIINVLFDQCYIVLEIKLGNKKIVLVNVYLNSDTGSAASLEGYLNTLHSLSQLLDRLDFDIIMYIGDWNANPGSRAWLNLSNFINLNSLTCFDFNQLALNSFTFVGYGYSNCRWLDHMVGRCSQDSKICNMEILHEMCGSDHFPIIAELEVANLAFSTIPDSLIQNSSTVKTINWKKLTDDQFRLITDNTIKEIGDFALFSSTKCTSVGCQDINHKQEIIFLYDTIVNSISSSAEPYSRSSVKKDKFKIIPGWNRRVKIHYSKYRDCLLNWIAGGRERDCPLFHQMSELRKIFKKELKECRKNEKEEISISIEEKFENKNFDQFWKDVKRKKEVDKQSTLIDGKINEEDIINIFNNKFMTGNGSVDDGVEEENLINRIRHSWNNANLFHLKISPFKLKALIGELNCGVGHDGIHTDFLNRVSNDFLLILTIFFNTCLTHSFLPPNLLRGTIKPTIKNRGGNLTESTNYRPVMKSSCLLKILEQYILEILKEKLFFNSRQFGFEQDTSTADAAFLVKEIAYNYTRARGSMYSAFLDMSQAFERVDHFILGKKLLDNNIPPDIVLFLLNYLRNQSARVKWGQSCGSYYNLNSGLRQGGILSPILFKFYIDAVLDEISNLDIGCRLGLSRVNLIAYADDLVILAPNMDTLEKIYIRLKRNLQKLKLILNSKKSKIIIFNKSKLKENLNIKLDNDDIEIVEEFKYLGFYLNSQLKDNKDIETKLTSFYKKFHSLMNNFNSVSLHTVIFLFNSFCSPDYGLSLWNCELTFKTQIFKSFEIAFGKAFKRMLGVPYHSSTHITANICGLSLLNHHVAKSKVRFTKRILDSKNRIFNLNMGFLKSGFLLGEFFKFYRKIYAVSIIGNEIKALLARIDWVQLHEPQIRICPFFNPEQLLIDGN